jgi:hypothetical protein
MASPGTRSAAFRSLVPVDGVVYNASKLQDGEVNVSALAGGNYVIRLIHGDGKVYNSKFAVVR